MKKTVYILGVAILAIGGMPEESEATSPLTYCSGYGDYNEEAQSCTVTISCQDGSQTSYTVYTPTAERCEQLGEIVNRVQATPTVVFNDR